MNLNPIIGVIQWLKDSAKEPGVIVGDSIQQVQAAVVEMLWPMLEDRDIENIGQEWIDANPKPDASDPEAVSAWLGSLREETTDAWLTLYGPEDAAGDHDGYLDVREA